MSCLTLGSFSPVGDPRLASILGRGVGMARLPAGHLGSVGPTDEQRERGRAFASWLRGAIERSGLNGKALADKCGVSSTYIYDLLRDGMNPSGVYKRPSESVIRSIAEVTGADVRDGLSASGYVADIGRPYTPQVLAALPLDAQRALSQFIESLPSTIMPLGGAETLLIPVLGSVGAGSAAFAAENIRERIAIPRQMVNTKLGDGEVFALRVQGDCLLGLHICDGDLLICKQQDHARDREIVIVIEGEEALAKRYRESPTRRWVETVPAAGSPEQVPLGDDARIIGVKVGMFREGN